MSPGSAKPLGLTSSTQRLLTPDEAADMLRLSKSSIYRLVDKRLIPFHKVSGSLRFSRKDLEEYISDGRIEPVS